MKQSLLQSTEEQATQTIQAALVKVRMIRTNLSEIKMIPAAMTTTMINPAPGKLDLNVINLTPAEMMIFNLAPVKLDLNVIHLASAATMMFNPSLVKLGLNVIDLVLGVMETAVPAVMIMMVMEEVPVMRMLLEEVLGGWTTQ